MTITATAAMLGVSQASVSQWAGRNGVQFRQARNDLSRLGNSSLDDYRALVIMGGYSSDEALVIISKRKLKTRAPNMAELIKHISNIGKANA